MLKAYRWLWVFATGRPLGEALAVPKVAGASFGTNAFGGRPCGELAGLGEAVDDGSAGSRRWPRLCLLVAR